MDALNLLTSLYGSLYNRSGIPYWVLTPFRRLTRMLARNILPSYLDKPYTGRASKQVDVIVSLTSFPKRIGEVWQVVECLKRQTLRPEKIILWLAKNQFPREDSVPLSLRSRLDSLFEIRFVEEDIRSHKKYYYAFQEYPEKLILLVDDDIYYSPRMIEELYDSYISQSGKRVICSYGSIIKYNQDGIRLPYSQWTPANSKNNHSGLFFGSGGGTLIHPSDLYEDITNKDLFLNLTPTADDIWLNAMCRLGNVKIVKARNMLLLPISITDDQTLSSVNNGKSQNDIQLDEVDAYYTSNYEVSPFLRQR